jgi:tripartite-type tricarboxylate transporter receptor subunit TctC
MGRSTMFWIMAGLLFATSPVFGQTFPDKPVRMVIPFPPGGSIDTVGRTVAQKWAVTLNQQIVIDNRGGAGGTIGTELVAKSRPDGYTIVYGNAGPLSIGLHIYKKIGYDLFKDFAPVS